MSKVDCKVVLLGSSAVGKTCLLGRYIHGHFVGKTSATICGSFASKKEVVAGKPISLGIWDTAGSERYATMSRMYYRHARAAIVCYSIIDRETFDTARHWISELLDTEEDCKIYLCGTKLDLVEEDSSRRAVTKENTRTLADDLSADFFETSSKTGENIDSLFSKIAKDFVIENGGQVKQCGNLQDSFKLPTSWTENTSRLKRDRKYCCSSS